MQQLPPYPQHAYSYSLSLPPSLSLSLSHTHTHTHTHDICFSPHAKKKIDAYSLNTFEKNLSGDN